MSKVEIEFGEPGRIPTVVVDGLDISTSTRGFEISAGHGHLPRLTLDLMVVDASRIESPHVQVLLDSTTAAYLERAGWTPPPGTASALTRTADGCPCDWLDFGDPEPVLGRTVPTCPVHGDTREDQQ